MEKNIWFFSTHKHYIEFLKILAATNSIKVSTRTMNIQSGTKEYSDYRPYITAIKSKPFLLLAGISGTGKKPNSARIGKGLLERRHG